ncbi:hypothetical protein F5877DRAFT_36814, partial [Lentinula edodes]
MDTSSGKLKDGLPGILKLYIGMPIIMKHENLNTELGVNNGSRGFLRKLDLSFPDSKVHLPGLPLHFFPVKARSWKCSTFIINENEEKILVSVTRTQLPFEPLFALTGQGAQGHTLGAILCMLHLGGFGAYVAASRPRSRDGLFI